MRTGTPVDLLTEMSAISIFSKEQGGAKRDSTWKEENRREILTDSN